MSTRDITSEERQEIENYLYLDEDQLYSLLPQFDSTYDHTSFSPDGQEAAGKTIFQSIKENLDNKICKEWAACKKLNDPNFEDTTKLVVVIGDAIATVTVMIPPFLIASILVKIGVRKFCQCIAKEK